MGRIVGTVTRMVGNRLGYGYQNPGQAAPLQHAYIARPRRAAGPADTFPTAGTAQRYIDNMFGGKRLRWTREDLRGDIEHWVGRTADLLPPEIWGEDLIVFSDGQAGVVLATDPNVKVWGDQSGYGNSFTQYTAANQPSKRGGFVGLGVLELDPAAPENMVSADASADVAARAQPYFVLFVVASYTGPAAQRTLIATGSSARLGCDPTGTQWRYENDSDSLIGGTANSSPSVVTAIQGPAGPDASFLRVNGTQIAAGVDAAGSPTTVLLSQAASPWAGQIAFFALAVCGTPTDRRIAQTENYLQRLYQP